MMEPRPRGERHMDVCIKPGAAPSPKTSRVPKGGLTGEVLTKKSDADGDTCWTQPVTEKDIEDAVKTAVGDISALLDAINGEVV